MFNMHSRGHPPHKSQFGNWVVGIFNSQGRCRQPGQACRLAPHPLGLLNVVSSARYPLARLSYWKANWSFIVSLQLAMRF